MRITYKKRMRVSGFLIMMMLLSGCGNSTDRANGSNATTSTVEMTTEAVTEAPDTTSPVIELASDTVAYYVGDKYDPMDYVTSVTDDKDENIKAEYDDKNVNIASPGDYVISYSATDTAGNSTEKELNFKVKKEYTRDEIKEIAQDLIDNEYYNLEISDDHDYDESEFVEGTYTGGMLIFGNFDDIVGDVPIWGIWGDDPKVYTAVSLNVYINDMNYGLKNANKDTVNSELFILVRNHSGEGKMENATSVEIFSDSGKLKVDKMFEKGSWIYDEPGYFKDAYTRICFNSESQIDEFKKILEANNVSIKVHYEEKEDFSYTLRKNQSENWLKMIRFYDDINEYVNNIPVEE